MLLASRSYDDLNVLPKNSEKVHEPLHGKGAGLASHERGNVGLLDPQYLAGRCLSKPAVFDKPVNLQRQSRFELPHVPGWESRGLERYYRYPVLLEFCFSSSQFSLSP
jgi:hypothetical protein